MKFFSGAQTLKLAIVAGLVTTVSPAVRAAPTVEVAKRCVHYAYIAYPWKRPGSTPMSGDRQAYINDCFAKNGDVPQPTPPAKKN